MTTKRQKLKRAKFWGAKMPRIHVASQWQLIWWRFRRHKLALFSLIVLIFIYLIVLFAEFLAPYDPADYSARYTYAPPQALHLIDDSMDNWFSSLRQRL